MNKHKNNRAFTLIELSIVLIIIGLLVGGILVGRELIGQAKIFSVINEANKLKAAYNTFMLKYDAIAGDYNNAIATGIGTIEGDGDGWVEMYQSSGGIREDYGFWEHMGNSGILKGNYTPFPVGRARGGPNVGGDRYSSCNSAQSIDPPLANTYCSAYADKGWASWSALSPSMAGFRVNHPHGGPLYETRTRPGPWRTFFFLGSGLNAYYTAALFPTIDLHAIDQKTDDGRPYTGKIQATFEAYDPDDPSTTRISTCMTANDATATYDLTVTGPTCMLIMYPQ